MRLGKRFIYARFTRGPGEDPYLERQFPFMEFIGALRQGLGISFAAPAFVKPLKATVAPLGFGRRPLPG